MRTGADRTRRKMARLAALVVATTTVLAGAVFGSGTPARAADTAGAGHPVGVTTETFVDTSRPTAANGSCAKLPSRTLPTTIYYPAAAGTPTGAAQPDAAPDTAGGPYPLIVFAHGFGATPATYAPLLEHWASAGYVVAAPTFPLSSGASPCGPIAGDVINQPRDMSFVITSMIKQSDGDDAPLSKMVDRHHIGAAGHSNGGITMYGLTGNTALRDKRVSAVAILAGTAQKYPEGKNDLAHLPPVLFVHGTADDLVPYSAAVDGFNHARGPKGLLSITNGDHGSSASPLVEPATTDFFDAYLRDDAAARRRLPDDQVAGSTTMKWVAEEGSTATVPTIETPVVHLKAKVTPNKGLTGGQMVTVKWSGYTPGKVVNVLQCNASDRDLSNSGGCDFAKAKILQPNPTGSGSLQLEIVEGTVGDGVCDADHPGCFIIVNNASSTDPKDSVRIDIGFAR